MAQANGGPDRSFVTQDPLIAVWLVALAFFCLSLLGIGNIPEPFFDERHYVPAANHLLFGDLVANREHPPFAKELIALSIAALGDNPLGWRFATIVAGTVSVIAWSRAVWWHSASFAASLLFAVLLATNFLLFALSRLALLDTPMFALTGLAILFFLRARAHRGWLVPCGISLGLALACKWTAAPVALVLGMARLWIDRRTPWTCLASLLLLPMVTYSATFFPLFLTQTDPLSPTHLPALHLAMIRRVSLFVTENSNASLWWQWALNTRPMVLAKTSGDSIRIILIGGNPLTTPAILPAILAGLLMARRYPAATLPALMYLVTLLFWPLSGKPVQYEYHYLLPSAFGLAALAIVMGRSLPLALAAGLLAGAVFVWFLPVLTGTALTASDAAERYGWLPGWAQARIVITRTGPDMGHRLKAAELCLARPQECP